MLNSAVKSDLPLVTIIALCYNHEKYVVECLEHIRAQTYTNTELIIMDDCSRDRSAFIISDWIEKNEVSCTFIAHTRNVGICKSLNEALSRTQGEHISMIATDDTWEPEKIEHQVAIMQAQPEQVAVVFSDAAQVDESGHKLAKKFIEANFTGRDVPSGRIFSNLVDHNFIPAMSTLIRRKAIEAVGGYDERLTYEDYDMWLRLSAAYDFVFCPGTVASYRIVATSMIRTLFAAPTANHSYSQFLIYEKWLKSDLLTLDQRKGWNKILSGAAYLLYVHDDSRARMCLWKTYFRTWNLRVFLQALTCSLGISRSLAKKLNSIMGNRCVNDA